MNYLELINIVNGDYGNAKEVKNTGRRATTDDILQFKRLLRIDETYALSFNKTNSAKEFYDSYELFAAAFNDNVKEDVFYGAKLGFILEGIPSRLTYLLKLAIANAPTPSLAIQSVSPLAWGKALDKGYLPEGITIKDVLDELYGYETKLISKTQFKQDHHGFSEIYVANVDRICLLPSKIAGMFGTVEDINMIKYIPGKGVCFGEDPIRLFDGMKGITFDEFDLRDVE